MSFVNTGNLIRKKHKEKKLKNPSYTGVWLGRQLGVTSQFVSNWKRHVSAPPLDKVKTVCLLLEISKREYEEAWLEDHRKALREALK